jgi:hypothetical protein
VFDLMAMLLGLLADKARLIYVRKVRVELLREGGRLAELWVGGLDREPHWLVLKFEIFNLGFL